MITNTESRAHTHTAQRNAHTHNNNKVKTETKAAEKANTRFQVYHLIFLSLFIVKLGVFWAAVEAKATTATATKKT